MAEATQATNDSTLTEALQTGASTSTSAPAITQTDATKPPVPGEKDATNRRLNPQQRAMARAEAAIAKLEAAGKTPAPAVEEKKAETQPAEGAKAEDSKPADAKDDKKPEEDKKEASEEDKKKAEAEQKAKDDKAIKENPKLSRAFAIVAERERKVAKQESEFKAKIEAERREFEATKRAFESERATDSEDLAFVRKVRETMHKDGKYAAARLLGFTMEELVEAKSHEVEPNAAVTAEEIARRIIREENERREKAAEEARKAKEEEDRKEKEKTTAQKNAEAAEFVDRVVQEHNADTSKRRFLARSNTNGDQIWNLAQAMETQLGRKVTPTEVLDKAEEMLRNQWEPLLKEQAAPAPAPAPEPEPAKVEPTKAQPKQESAQQQRGKRQRPASPLDRANAALQRRGLA